MVRLTRRRLSSDLFCRRPWHPVHRAPYAPHRVSPRAPSGVAVAVDLFRPRMTLFFPFYGEEHRLILRDLQPISLPRTFVRSPCSVCPLAQGSIPGFRTLFAQTFCCPPRQRRLQLILVTRLSVFDLGSPFGARDRQARGTWNRLSAVHTFEFSKMSTHVSCGYRLSPADLPSHGGEKPASGDRLRHTGDSFISNTPVRRPSL